MSKRPVPPLPSRKVGEILREAYLITPVQLEEALREHSRDRSQALGDILARKGWIKQKTADFFAGQWREIIQNPEIASRKPLGFYLKEAGLLDEEQIQEIVREQNERTLWVRLGTMAVLKGWLAQSTIDFFLKHLYPEHAGDSPFVKPIDKETRVEIGVR
ncbi:hypothetical protein V0288_19635 [Pannus brasiliensis CCIBt3594]|uniref:Regulatory protein RecX n=1 Tax=Pannus brasiliensis CCIBt3594 TaxID=1427578 RepID=A0AAW9QQL0_9CHRO